jgi:type VI protein secretion system component Hcp
MKIYDPETVKALQALRDAVVEELDMDAVSPKLGQAVNKAEELLDAESRFRRENAFGDQSKW